jgi:hypothetical protein
MKSFLKRFILLIVAAAFVTGLIFAFIQGHKEAGAEAEREKPVKAPTRVQLISGQNVVTLDHAAQDNSGVVLSPLEVTLHRQQIPAYGVVLDLQELTDLRNALETARAQFNKANAAKDVAQQDYQRSKALYEKNQNVSEKTVQAAEGTLRGEEGNVQIAQAAVNAAQATALQHWGTVVAGWLATDDSHFERLRVQKDFLVQVTLSPDPATATQPPTASVQTADGRQLDATLVSAAPRTDPKIQGQSFLYIVSGQATNLLPGMNVTALLPVGDAARGVIVPASAVVWFQGKAWAYMEIEPDRFARREVATEQPIPNGWFQAKGFSTGEVLVTQGPQVLLSEEFRAQISVGEEGQ